MNLSDLDRATIRSALSAAATRIEQGFPLDTEGINSDASIVGELRRLRVALTTPAERERLEVLRSRLAAARVAQADVAVTEGSI